MSDGLPEKLLAFMKKSAIARLKELQQSEDLALSHTEADLILTTLLVSLGFEDVVEEYRKVNKWYE